MAPATFAGAASEVRKGRPGSWDRDSIINAIREWVAVYDEPPRAADWNPSSAKWSGQTWRIERYREGRADGSAWPALNSAKRPFDGSLTQAIRAAGFEPAKPGPVRRSDVQPEQADRAVISPQGRAMLDAALAREREALTRVVSLEAQAVRAHERVDGLRAERDAARSAAKAKPKVVREAVADATALSRAVKAAGAAERKAVKATEAVAGARMDAAEARTTATGLAARLERTEATVSGLRSERRDLRTRLEEALDELRGTDELLAQARCEAARVAAPTVVRVTEATPDGEAVRAAVAEAEAAQREANAARREAVTAERRADEAERALGTTVAAVTGEARRLTPAELTELRANGPAGPAVLAAALTELAHARKGEGGMRTGEALQRVAQAAITWQDRL